MSRNGTRPLADQNHTKARGPETFCPPTSAFAALAADPPVIAGATPDVLAASDLRSEQASIGKEKAADDELATLEQFEANHLWHPVDGWVAEDVTDGRPEWATELVDWWHKTAASDIGGSIDKIVAYGGSGPAYDLIATGHDLAKMNGREKVSDEEAVELGILFYLSSKVNRWMAAAIDGRRPSDDTLLDVVYYAMMSRRNRAVGGWPVA